MRGSWRIGQLFGIDVYVHWTFLFLPAFIIFRHYSVDNSWAVVVNELIFVLMVFGIVVLHELGHALTARRFGIATRDITLLPIGGVARLERMPEDPWQELLVALAGPAVNFVLAGVCVVGLLIVGEMKGLFDLPPTAESEALVMQFMQTSWLMRLMAVNLFLALFNLIPAFPMDGGRVLRAVLAMTMDYVRATQVAAFIGQIMAGLFALFGVLSGNWILLFIALFVWIGASQESSMTQIKAGLSGIPVARAMVRDFRTLTPYEPLGQAVQHVLGGFQEDFPVQDDGQVVGILTRPDLIRALSQQGLDGRVGDVMRRQFETASPDEMLERVLARLHECDCHSMPVLKGGQLVGLVTAENIGEFLMVQSALRGSPGRG